MSYFFLLYQCTISTVGWLLTMAIPGGGLLLSDKNKLAFSIPFLGLLWVGVISWSRGVLTPTGFLLMLAGLFIIQLACITQAIRFRASNTNFSFNVLGKFGLLITLNVIIILSCHLFKDKWFGFAFYHIPSESMNPTLRSGDVALVDTWAYKQHAPAINDILIVKRSATGLVLAKRLKDIRKLVDQTELYVVGDNQNYSIDSRRFGWITDEYLIGEVKFIWFSFLNENRYLTSAK